ncbi:hypothetical protein OR214_02339 [Ralstonia pickettii OR214]|jgi:hypothetical protein|uniref:Uncharacterized protein n=2 Tax=Ralstonia pickettii TaxID=329 RepID=R0DXB3_RALPI|nr:hypothetical protein OR214_02339 [Ralstonia pickettii OR214]
MTHRFSTLTDSEIDAIASTRFWRCVCLVLALMALFIVSAGASIVVDDGNLVTLTRSIALLSITLLGLVCSTSSEPNELSRLEDVPRMLDQTLDLLKRSEAARQLRDEILGSGRVLRVFDFQDLTSAHEKALHRQKVQQMNGLVGVAEG